MCSGARRHATSESALGRGAIRMRNAGEGGERTIRYETIRYDKTDGGPPACSTYTIRFAAASAGPAACTRPALEEPPQVTQRHNILRAWLEPSRAKVLASNATP